MAGIFQDGELERFGRPRRKKSPEELTNDAVRELGIAQAITQIEQDTSTHEHLLEEVFDEPEGFVLEFKSGAYTKPWNHQRIEDQPPYASLELPHNLHVYLVATADGKNMVVLGNLRNYDFRGAGLGTRLTISVPNESTALRLAKVAQGKGSFFEDIDVTSPKTLAQKVLTEEGQLEVVANEETAFNPERVWTPVYDGSSGFRRKTKPTGEDLTFFYKKAVEQAIRQQKGIELIAEGKASPIPGVHDDSYAQIFPATDLTFRLFNRDYSQIYRTLPNYSGADAPVISKLREVRFEPFEARSS